MKIEYLFPEHCNLFGDPANIKYLSQCLPTAQIIETHFTEEPRFLTEKVDLVYMGGMTEDMQEQIAAKLMPYRDRIKELIEEGQVFLVTSNAVELFGTSITKNDKTKFDTLNIFDFESRINFYDRLNSLVLGTYNNLKIIGFKTQFSTMYAKNFKYPFMNVTRGLGMNKKSSIEGVCYRNFFGTYLVGPFLVLNPLFVKHLLTVMGVKNPQIAHEEAMMDAYQYRLEEFENPKTKY